jgi:hypothetical protein
MFPRKLPLDPRPTLGDQPLEITPKALKMPPQLGEALR